MIYNIFRCSLKRTKIDEEELCFLGGYKQIENEGEKKYLKIII
jgi:hypothetical protein